eukprot:g9592.t1
MPPAAKRARSGAGGSDQALTPAECDKLVERLSKETAHALLAKFVASSPEVRAAVEVEIDRRDAEAVDLSVYSREAREVVCSLDRLRPSQQFTRSGEVYEKLVNLVVECKEMLSSCNAISAIVAIMETVESEAEGEVRKGVLGCGGIESKVASELKRLADDMSSEEKASISDAVEDLHGVVEALEPYGLGDDLKEVVTLVRGN